MLYLFHTKVRDSEPIRYASIGSSERGIAYVGWIMRLNGGMDNSFIDMAYNMLIQKERGL
jgi:hypothetical protein